MTDKPTIQIQGFDFEVPVRYAAGHILKENEAKALNQTFWENLRNNFASTIKGALKEIYGEKVPDDAKLDDDKMLELQAQLEDYAEKYEFAVRGSGISTPRDPVMAEAIRIALSAVKESIKAQGGSPKDYEAESLNTVAKQLVADDPEYMEAAQSIIARRQALASKQINLPAKAA